MNAKHETLLFHTETRWFTKREDMLARLSQISEELKGFFLVDEGMKYFMFEQYCKLKIKLQVVYLADLFVHLNDLNF